MEKNPFQTGSNLNIVKKISIPERALFGTSSHKAQEKFSLVEDFDDKIPPGDTGADP
jgi:hypothetical protein